MYEDGTSGLLVRVLPPVSATQIARGVPSDGQQIVVPSLFQYRGKFRLSRPYPRRLVLRLE